MPKTPPCPELLSREAVRLLRNWSKQLDVDDGTREDLSSDEREELRRPRRENRLLVEEREILSERAAAFFAQDNDRTRR